MRLTENFDGGEKGGGKEGKEIQRERVNLNK
jgi:hypothetical protein